jgi:hypothetical protein
MRTIAIALGALGLLGTAAGAMAIDASQLVVQQADVPAYRLVPAESGRRTNRSEARTDPEVARLAARAGRTSASVAVYEDGKHRIRSRADLFRSAAGAKTLLRYADGDLRRAGIKGLRRTTATLGAEGWIFSGGVGDAAIAVAGWRQGRVFAAVATTGLSRSETLAVARRQQLRITHALG